MDVSFAICVLITLGFGAFIVWGRSAAGRQTLRQTLGEPTPRPQTYSAKAKNSASRRTATKSSSRPVGKKSSETPASAPSSAAKPSRASASISRKTTPQKPTASSQNNNTPRFRKP